MGEIYSPRGATRARHTLRNDQQPFPTGCQLVKKISVPACVRMLKRYVAIEFRCGMLITCRGLSVTPVFTENNKDGHELETMRYFQYRRRLPRPNIEETDKIGYFWDSAGPCRLQLYWVVAHGLYTAGKHRMMPMAGDKRDRAARFRVNEVCWHRIKCPKSGLSEPHERTIHCFSVPVVWYKCCIP